MDYSNQPLYSWRYRAYSNQYDNPLLLWNIPVQVDWRQKIPHHLLFGRDTGEHFLYTPGATFLHSYRRLRSYFCPGWNIDINDTKIESFYFPHTSPPPPLGSRHWRFPHTLPLPPCSLAGSPRRSGSRPHRRLSP